MGMKVRAGKGLLGFPLNELAESAIGFASKGHALACAFNFASFADQNPQDLQILDFSRSLNKIFWKKKTMFLTIH